ncbi:hypothetical protein NLU13_4911 [Sarocladium strictum]|uniref:poly(ADP-ribose) glycohydrolase n=1 Tax=Sarocladium strictum TaxID=5046 RepID=A0AA39L953_SARSR|nr:hypothetical protein NLU13_4911 [Sarocladium strictum]
MDQSFYFLPNSPTNRRLDRFSILNDDQEGEDGPVPFWALLQHVLQPNIESSGQLIEVLDTVSNILRDSSGSAGEYGTLKSMVDGHGPAFFVDVWPKIVYCSLQLQECFPEGRIPVLQPGTKLQWTRLQVASLVANQFLCSLDCPAGRDGYFDFSIWYASEQRHPYSAQMYLKAVFEYFRQLQVPFPDEAASNPAKVVYSMHDYHETSPPSPEPERVPLQPISVQMLESYDTRLQEHSHQEPDGAVVISANKDIGFGNSPEACPAVLVTPTLQATETVTIEGAAPMLCITGQRRNVQWEVLPRERRIGGRMLFMDALEIDELDGSEALPDIQPGHLEREIRKAYTAFSSWASGDESTVYTGVWGCGAFNGDPGVKMTILWIAASMAGRRLTVVCDDSHGGFPMQFRGLVDRVPSSWTVRELRTLLESLAPDTQRSETVKELSRLLE